MGEAGRRRAVDELGWDAVAGRYRAAYAEGTARRAAGTKPAAAWRPGAARVRVLLVTNTYPPADLSGVGTLACELARRLGHDGHFVTVLTRRPPA